MRLGAAVGGSSGPCPDTNIMFPHLMPWASGDGVALSLKPVVGAVAEVMICFGIVWSF